MAGHTYCSVVGCKNSTRKQSELSYFQLPKDMARRKIWAARIGRMDVIRNPNPKRCHVCGEHFEWSMFVNKRLCKTALPTLNLPKTSDAETLDEEAAKGDSKDPAPSTSAEESPNKPERPSKRVKYQIVLENEEFVFQEVYARTPSPPPEPDSSDHATSCTETYIPSIEEIATNTTVSSTVTAPEEENIVLVNCNFQSDMMLIKCDDNTAKQSEAQNEIKNSETYIVKEEQNMGICNLDASNTYVIDIGNCNIENGILVNREDNNTIQKESPEDMSNSQINFIVQEQELGDKIYRLEVNNSEHSLPEQSQESPALLENSEIHRKISDNETKKPKRKQDSGGNKRIKRCKRIQRTSSDEKILENDKKVKKSCSHTSSDKISKLKKVINSKYKGNVNHVEFQLFALNLYISSPKVYKTLRKILLLPGISHIKKEKVHFVSGVSDDAIQVLSSRLKKRPHNYRYCIIVLNEMELQQDLTYDINSDGIVGLTEVDGNKSKKVARKALHLSIKGCMEKYTQPLGYAFTGFNDDFVELTNWLHKVIKKLRKAEFIVCAVVSHHEQYFTDFAHSLGVTKLIPFFKVNNKKIFYVFDAPHLIKKLQEVLFKHKFLYIGSDLISWNHIEAFYNKDKERAIRMAPKLTDSHLNPDICDEISYGSQVFSYSVAAGMSALIRIGHLPPDAQHTANFILSIDQLFDVLTSSNENYHNKYKQPFRGEGYQITCLEESLKMIENIDSFSTTGDECATMSAKTFNALQISINAILNLHKYFTEDGFESFATEFFNLDSPGYFFDAIRKNIGNSNITAIQFKKAYSELMIDSLLDNGPELDAILGLESFLALKPDKKENILFKSEMLEVMPSSLNIPTKDFNKDLPVENTFLEVCSSLLRICLETHDCQALNEHAISEYWLQVSPAFVNYVRFFENVFVENFEIDMLQYGTGFKLLNKLELLALNLEKPCRCFPVKYFASLFVRMRIAHVLKHWNSLCVEHLTGDVNSNDMEVFPL